MIRSAAVLLLLAGCAAPPGPMPPTPPPSDSIDRLIDLLNSENIESRQSAENQLVDLGPAIRDRLEQSMSAAASSEVAVRIRQVLERIDTSLFPMLPTDGFLGDVWVHFMHAFIWQNQPPARTTFVSTVWTLKNQGEADAEVRIIRGRIVHPEGISEAAFMTTKLEPDPLYKLGAGTTVKPALKAPAGPDIAAGQDAYAVIDFMDAQGRTLRLRTRETGVERAK